ncbi:squalene synthase HpnC [Comamonas resistens]|uniref:Squalene synthase HpnC n=1 Tax=Comamonas resistens TaxID=3046670 RepID=A0ABY8SY69_9BURK|nr:squalene synthase HpnC [Comamonas resistens]MDL5038157.1 squalene synthase HpnC [Comamonas resistens]WHS67878.1 squalene synthase HpnC [Comamonas resistens]
MHPATSAAAQAPAQSPSITHYENFPVASWLCPPRLRAPIAALYHFARTADDIADEGDFSAEQRLEQLQRYGHDLQQLGTDAEAEMLACSAWPQVFAPLARQMQTHQLPKPLMADLLSAFEQDVRMTASQTPYADMAQLIDYCRRSANPVGRLLLHLYGVDHAQALTQSDAICTALQLINFWQDLSQDLPRQRHYLPDADLARHGIARSAVRAQASALTPALQNLLAELHQQARSLMEQGAPLVHQLPGRAGWELRLVVQGGLRVLEHLESMQGRNLYQRIKLRKQELPTLLWRAIRM